MKKIISQIKSYISYYPLWYWILLLTFCAFSVYVNYAWGLQIAMDNLRGWQEYGAYIALYAAHSLFAFVLYSLVSKSIDFWRKPGFWILLMLGFMVFAFRAVIWQHVKIIDVFSQEENYHINHLVYNDVFRFLYLCIPISIIWFFNDRKEMAIDFK